jgi:carbamoyl-phosphate synthase large subunit
MQKILIAGAGGAPSEGVINSLLRAGYSVVGMGSEPTDLMLSAAERKYYVPYANASDYPDQLLSVIAQEAPGLVHFQNDLEVFHASKIRSSIHAAGCRTFMPTHDVIDTCVHKYKSWLKFKQSGLTVPDCMQIFNEQDLSSAFQRLANSDGHIWLRSSSIGGGGKGALPTNSFDFAKSWIQHHSGWGDFVAAQMLTKETVTWMSIWFEGELVVAQSRSRRGWTHGNRTVSGVTGVTKVGVTVRDGQVDEVAQNAILAVDSKPHGIYGVDMAYDSQGVPNPTEINISRFFTTVLFFTEAGLNMPAIFAELGLSGKTNYPMGTISPLDPGLMWLRGMDVKPRLCTENIFQQEITLV